MTKQEAARTLEIVRKKKAAIDRRQERLAQEIKVWEAIRDRKGVKVIQELLDYFRK